MQVLITGSNGFIGKNLKFMLANKTEIKIKEFNRQTPREKLDELIQWSDVIFHLAGENRTSDVDDFYKNNTLLTQQICEGIYKKKRSTPIIFTSSTQASEDNPYGISKLASEKLLENLYIKTKNPVIIYRLPGIFGKWGKPNYNSVVNTFCHNFANNLEIQIYDPKKLIKLGYIDDLVMEFTSILNEPISGMAMKELQPLYIISVEDLVQKISQFVKSRKNLMVEPVGEGLLRALYSTFLSYLPIDQAVYNLPTHTDSRGNFVEIIKTKDYGQFSFLTAKPGSTRGGHYHNSKTEKFLVVCGSAKFRFKNILNNNTHEFITTDKKYEIVETIPGWAHDITNIGSSELIAFIWASEQFNTNLPDTYLYALSND